MFIIETFETDGRGKSRRLITEPGPIRIEVDKYDNINILTVEKFCKTCDGSGGVRYYYSHNEKTDCACPVCNNGNVIVWKREKKAWENRNE